MTRPSTASPPLGESVVDEVRTIREAIDAEVGHDLQRLAELARRTSEQVRRTYGLNVAALPVPTRPTTRRAPSD